MQIYRGARTGQSRRGYSGNRRLCLSQVTAQHGFSCIGFLHVWDALAAHKPSLLEPGCVYEAVRSSASFLFLFDILQLAHLLFFANYLVLWGHHRPFYSYILGLCVLLLIFRYSYHLLIDQAFFRNSLASKYRLPCLRLFIFFFLLSSLQFPLAFFSWIRFPIFSSPMLFSFPIPSLVTVS